MDDGFGSVLNLTRDSLPKTVIDEAALQRLSLLCECLPATFSTFWGFESRLGEPQATVDVLFEIKKHSPGHRFLTGASPSALDTLCERWPIWKQLRHFARLWEQPDHLFNAYIRNIWLEFDLAAVSSSLQVSDTIGNPCIFWGPTHNTPLNERFLRLLLEEMCAFQPADVSDQSLQSFVASLPDQAQLFQLGMMVSRQQPLVRVCVNQIASRDMADWLEGLHWPGDPAALADILTTLDPLLGSVAIDLDLTASRPAEKIGIECYMDWSNEQSDQWLPLLDYIEPLTLCIPSKRNGILEFPGIKWLISSEQHEFRGIVYPKLIRNIHHIKLSVVDNRITEVKAYLGVHRPGVNCDLIRAHASVEDWLIE